MQILGAGMAGCLAALVHKDAQVIEKSPEGANRHEALLRFRSPKIGEALGIPFEEVQVHKAIWYHNNSVPVSPKMIALYSRKVSSTVMARSICDISTVARWCAPPTFHDMLLQLVGNRVAYDTDWAPEEYRNAVSTPIISTIPIFAMAEKLGMKMEHEVNFQSIYINKFILPNCNMHATVYYPHPENLAYRATLTGDILIIESLWELGEKDYMQIDDSLGVLHLPREQILTNHIQRIGKMVPMNEHIRGSIIVKATMDYNIYALGRFATWRNLLLDDVWEDIKHINTFINRGIYYLHKELLSGR